MLEAIDVRRQEMVRIRFLRSMIEDAKKGDVRAEEIIRESLSVNVQLMNVKDLGRLAECLFDIVEGLGEARCLENPFLA